MRTLIVLVVIGALAYLGWTRRSEVIAFAERWSPQKITATGDTVPAEPPPAGGMEAPVTPAATPVPKRVPTPGVYYVIKRVSVQTNTGVKALNEGETVKLMYRNRDGTMRVSIGKEEFVLKESLLTNDPDHTVATN